MITTLNDYVGEYRIAQTQQTQNDVLFAIREHESRLLLNIFTRQTFDAIITNINNNIEPAPFFRQPIFLELFVAFVHQNLFLSINSKNIAKKPESMLYYHNITLSKKYADAIKKLASFLYTSQRFNIVSTTSSSTFIDLSNSEHDLFLTTNMKLILNSNIEANIISKNNSIIEVNAALAGTQADIILSNYIINKRTLSVF